MNTIIDQIDYRSTMIGRELAILEAELDKAQIWSQPARDTIKSLRADADLWTALRAVRNVQGVRDSYSAIERQNREAVASGPYPPSWQESEEDAIATLSRQQGDEEAVGRWKADRDRNLRNLGRGNAVRRGEGPFRTRLIDLRTEAIIGIGVAALIGFGLLLLAFSHYQSVYFHP